ncbi:putative nucleotidyltransferase, ribonuclease H [Tanacetum coccineum]|uniref:Nucleotidyltransferase, ribonuclease H n=1 Tax=Tanacetum coccineum TaxID=301880 RepID=A0ABQ4Z3K5_9ASTR
MIKRFKNTNLKPSQERSRKKKKKVTLLSTNLREKNGASGQPNWSPNSVLDNSSNDSQSNEELYLNDEEDDGDIMVVLQTPSKEIRTRIDNTRVPPPLIRGIGEDKIWDQIGNPLSPNHIKCGYSICCENIIDMINSIKDIREENRDMLSSINEAIKLILAVATNMSCVIKNDIGKEGLKDNLKEALEFQPGEHVFLKVSPTRGVRRFGIKGELSPRFIGPFEILDRVGEVSYRLALPPQLSHVHNVFHVSLLRGYKYHPLHVVSYPFDQIREDLSYTEEPESILDRQDRVMRNKTIPFVKILWRNHPEREATWETEESIRTSYPHFLP